MISTHCVRLMAFLPQLGVSLCSMRSASGLLRLLPRPLSVTTQKYFSASLSPKTRMPENP